MSNTLSPTGHSKKVWEPPFIQPHRLGEINKFGHYRQNNDYSENIFGIPAEELLSKYGSPLYVTSESKLRSNIQKIARAFQSRYSPVVHGWSYKTNYLGAICNILHQEGSWAEVVSRFEYEKARATGVPGSKIIFNGPNKDRSILERAISENALIHIDHMDELQLIEQIAINMNKVVPVAIRLNFPTGYTEPWAKFGFNVETGQAHQAAKLIALSSHLQLKGLHSHIGTFILEPQAYVEQVKFMCKLMREFEATENIEIDYIDIGGGFPSRNALQAIYLPPEQCIRDINDYADAICSTLIQECSYRQQVGKKLPTLIFESGRAVVDDAQTLLCNVVGTKRLADGRKAAILNVGTNLLFTAYWYNHQVKLTKPNNAPCEETVLYGPLCMNIDVVRQSVQLPPLVAGDVLAIHPVGAYNNTQWMQFIEYRPNVVLVHENGQVSVIRKAEDLSVFTAQEILPEHLQDPFPVSTTQ